jgi:hypothetical protein
MLMNIATCQQQPTLAAGALHSLQLLEIRVFDFYSCLESAFSTSAAPYNPYF